MTSSVLVLISCFLTTAAVPTFRDVSGRKSLSAGSEMFGYPRISAFDTGHMSFTTSLPSMRNDKVGVDRSSKQTVAVSSSSMMASDQPDNVGSDTHSIHFWQPKNRIDEAMIQNADASLRQRREVAFADSSCTGICALRAARRKKLVRRSAAGGEGGTMVVGWNKRPRYYRENEGGTTRDWRTNMMRVWGKRSSGIFRNDVSDDYIEAPRYVLHK